MGHWLTSQGTITVEQTVALIQIQCSRRGYLDWWAKIYAIEVRTTSGR